MTIFASDATDIFRADPLSLAQARQAFPLVQIANPHISLSLWLAFVKRWTRVSSKRGGILALRDQRGYLHALFTYQLDHNLRLGKFLRLSNIVMGHLPGKTLNHAILATAQGLLASTGAGALVVEPTSDEPPAYPWHASPPFGFLHVKQAEALIPH